MLIASRIRDGVRAVAGGLPRPFWVLWTGTLVNRFGTFVLPFLAIYLTQVRRFSILQAGMVTALYGAGAAIAGPLGGFLADHLGRRLTMIGALVLGGAGMIALGLAERPEVIAPACFLVALITEMYRPGMQAALADLVPPADRVRAFGLIYWVINLGFGIGLAVAGLLATVSYFLLFAGDGVTSMLFGLMVWRGVPETRPARSARSPERPRAATHDGFFAPYRDPTFMLFLGLNFLFALVFMQHTLALPLDMTAHGVSRPAFGAAIALNGAVIVLVQPFLGPALARRNPSRTLAAGATLVALGFGLNALARTAPVYAAGVVIWTLGEIATLPLASAVVADLAPIEVRGRYQGAYGLSFGLASCLAPTLGSVVLRRFGNVTLWSGCLVLGLVVAVGQLALASPLARERRARHAAHSPG